MPKHKHKLSVRVQELKRIQEDCEVAEELVEYLQGEEDGLEEQLREAKHRRWQATQAWKRLKDLSTVNVTIVDPSTEL